MTGFYGFDTDDRDLATAALCVYAIYRSRDRKRFKITPDLWAQIERFVKASAKRADSIPRFLEALKPRLACDTIHPRAMAVGVKGVPTVTFSDGSFAELGSEQAEQREFLTGVLAGCDQRRVIDALYRETAWVILLVRDRLERERPVEARFETALDGISAEGTETHDA